MKKIDVSTLTHPNTFALVDDKDYELQNKHKWYALEKRGAVYAARNISVGIKQKILLMHIAIMGRVTGKEIDHRNTETLDNQRHNLRYCTHAENARNRKTSGNNTSGYKGACWHKGVNKWCAYIYHNGKRIHLGYFTCLIKAAKVYDNAARKYFGEFARPNFPEVGDK